MSTHTTDDTKETRALNTPRDDIQVVGVVAIGRDGLIGVDGGLPWNLPQDLRHFRQLTEGSTVIVGRKTWENIEKRSKTPIPLPKRNVVVMSFESTLVHFYNHGERFIVKFTHRLSINQILNLYHFPLRIHDPHPINLKRFHVIGGREIYRAFAGFYTQWVITDVFKHKTHQPNQTPTLFTPNLNEFTHALTHSLFDTPETVAVVRHHTRIKT